MPTTGGVWVCVAALTLLAAASVFRSSDPPRWTARGWVGELVTLAIVCTFALGIGSLAAGVIDAFQTGPDYLDLGLLAGVLIATIAIWRRLNRRIRPRAAANEPAPVAGATEARPGAPAATAASMPVIAGTPSVRAT